MTTDDRRILAGRYVLETPIGRGGMGEVWRATDTVLGREVAVKTIDLRQVPDEAGAARFEREARVTAGTNHPNVVTVHDTGVEGDTAYLVMELLPGPSLADRLAEGPLPVEDVVDVGRQVAAALEAAHGRGLVHRDIKPGNLVYAADGRLRVVDFGITQLTDAAGDQALTATHTVMGTAEYLAPEQATGARVDGRADLYALGCVLFTLLTRSAPFRAATPVATMMMHAHDPVPDVRALRPDTPPWLADVVGSLLAKDPADRPADAGAVVRALDERSAPARPAATSVLPAAAASRAAATERLAPVTPPPPPPTTRATPPPPERRRRSGAAALWVLALVAVLALGLLAWSLFGPDAGTETAGPSPSASSSAAAPSSSAPEESTSETPSPSPSPTEESTQPEETADPGAAVTQAFDALTQAARDLQGQGGIDGDLAKKLDDQAREAQKALRDGDAEKVREAADKTNEEYGKAVEEGTVSEDAAATLDPLVQDVLDAAAAYAGGDPGGQGPAGAGKDKGPGAGPKG